MRFYTLAAMYSPNAATAPLENAMLSITSTPAHRPFAADAMRANLARGFEVSLLPTQPAANADVLRPLKKSFAEYQKEAHVAAGNRQAATQTDSRMWRQTTVLERADGRAEAFAIGPDGAVWSFTPDDRVAGGYRLQSLGLPADSISVVNASDGRIFVFAARGMSVMYRMEQPGEAERWSAPMRASLPQPPQGERLCSITAELIQGRVFVSVVCAAIDAGGQNCAQGHAMTFSVWSREGGRTESAKWFTDSSIDECWSQAGGDFRYTAHPMAAH